MSSPGGQVAGMRIGDVAAQAGVSSRTLRYYEERGIFQPSVHTSGGERRYGPEDVAQLRRILELRNGLGLTVEEVRVFIESERRLDALRSAYRETDRPDQRMGLVTEAIAIRRELVTRIDAKMAQLRPLRQELLAAIARQEDRLVELGQATVPELA
jgi:MerR family transcriptional regulator, repressor of the yfmOP operon